MTSLLTCPGLAEFLTVQAVRDRLLACRPMLAASVHAERPRIEIRQSGMEVAVAAELAGGRWFITSSRSPAAVVAGGTPAEIAGRILALLPRRSSA